MPGFQEHICYTHWWASLSNCDCLLFSGFWQYPFLTNFVGNRHASFSLAVHRKSDSWQSVIWSQLHSDMFDCSKMTLFELNGVSIGGLRNRSTKFCLFQPFPPEILSIVFLIVSESVTPLWMGLSQLTTLPVKSLHCSSNTSNSFPTTIWL